MSAKADLKKLELAPGNALDQVQWKKGVIGQDSDSAYDDSHKFVSALCQEAVILNISGLVAFKKISFFSPIYSHAQLSFLIKTYILP
jgi:hypothetical protein